MFFIKHFFKNNNVQQKFSFIHRTFLDESSNSGLTIYALSSGQGKCGVAVVRISGANARMAIEKMTNISKLEPRKAYLRNIRNPETGEIIDKGLCLWFPAPNSFTGEDSVEFQVHGGSAILAALMSSLSQLRFRAALPGEFTRRAFLNDKLDLTEIEGLADLIHAETEQQRKQALLQAQGSLGALYAGWRSVLLGCLAQAEAHIDFGEEEQLGPELPGRCGAELRELARRIEAHLGDGRRGEILRSGIRTAILGEPNAGKSSLLNRLVQRDAAIVSPLPGTTRDVLEFTANVAGYPILLADTAGLRSSSSDLVEVEGIRRAREQAERADFVVLLVNAERWIASRRSFDDYLRDYVESLELEGLLLPDGRLNDRCMLVVNKIDLLDAGEMGNLQKHGLIGISCANEAGFQDLLEAMRKHFVQICGNPTAENPTISQERHRNHVRDCHACLLNYFDITAKENYDVVLATQEIRKAARELGKITGHVSTEEVLDTIFQNFCIGK